MLKRITLLTTLLFALAFAMSPRVPSSPAGLQVVVTKWLESAECAHSTGAILVLCRNGGLVPIAAESPGDDPGHALVLDIYAATTGKIVSMDTLLTANALINFAGVAVLALLLFDLRLYVSATFVALTGPVIANQFNDYGPHAAQLGSACLAAILPIAILGIPLAKTRRSILWICAGVLCLSLAAAFRQSIGLMGLVASVIAIGISLRTERRFLLAHAALLLAAVLSYESPALLLRLCDVAYGLSSAGLMQRHGIWHNLYIGLGTDENPFGIQWLDSYGYIVASKANPGVGWATAAYYDTMRTEYFKLLTEHPLDVANIYLAKLGIVLTSQLPDPFGWVILWPDLLVIAALFAITGWKANRQIAAIQFNSALFICFFMGQAVLFHYRMLYLHPIEIFLAMSFGVCIDAAFARISWKQISMFTDRIRQS